MSLVIVTGGYYWISFRWTQKRLSDIYKWTFFFYGIAGLIFVIIFQSRILDLGRSRGIETIIILLFVLCAGGLIIAGSLKNASAKAEIEMLEYRDRIMEENYKEIQGIYQNYAYTYHDFKNHLLVLSDYCDRGEIKKASKYLKDLQEPIGKVRHWVKLGDEVLDIILNYKLENAAEKGIAINADIAPLEGVDIEAHDLCSIISNLLDNAIEACERLSSEERWIHITIKNLEDVIVIKVANSYCPEGKLAKPEKGKSKLHGYGQQAVKDKVKKYGGNVKYIIDEKSYQVIITFCVE